MKCPKCKNEIHYKTKICNYCGANIQKYKSKKYSMGMSNYESLQNYISLTKPRTNNKQTKKDNNKIQTTQNTINASTIIPSHNSHQAQVNYSMQYSNVQRPKANSHQDQVNYSNAYSKVRTQMTNTHQDQHNYSRTYSNIQKPKANDHQDQYNYSANYNINQSTQISTSEEIYIKSFIGDEYENIKKSTFSIPALLFGGFYLLYRKLWIYAIIWFIIALTLGFSPVFIIALNIFLAVNFSKIYLYYAKLIVSDIKTKNPDKASLEIMEICKEKGGVTKKINGKAFISFIIIIPILAFIYLFYYIDNVMTNNNEYITEELNIQYSIPDGYETTYDSDTIKSYESDNECEISVNVHKYNDDDIYSFLNNKALFKEETDTIVPKTINSNTWYNLEARTSYGIYNYLAIEKNNEKYLIEYYCPTRNSYICEPEFDSFINSLNFKDQIIYNTDDPYNN